MRAGSTEHQITELKDAKEQLETAVEVVDMVEKYLKSLK